MGENIIYHSEFLIEKKLLGEEILINYKKNNRFRETIEMVNLAIKEDGSRIIIGEIMSMNVSKGYNLNLI